MERIRLTQRNASKNRFADEKTPATLVDLGHEDRNRDHGQYDKSEEAIKYETQSKEDTWSQSNKRDEVGFGIPRMANVFVSAKKATKLSMMLLGDNAKEADLEAQARAFMRMGDKALTASINRWAAAQDCQNGDCGVDAEDEGAPATPAVEETPAVPATEETPAVPATEETPAVPATEETPAVPATDETPDIDVDGNDTNTDVDFGTTEEGEAPATDLAQVWDDSEPTETPAAEPAATDPTTTASRKAGVKRLNGGQPTLMRVASKGNELESLWDKWSNPDVR